MAHFTRLAAARHRALADAGWDVEADGLFGSPPIRVLIGATAHTTVFASLRMLGLGSRERCCRCARLMAEELARDARVTIQSSGTHSDS
jgi:glutamate/tyrosine decarboxylase-like PLP-dependent enzyme